MVYNCLNDSILYKIVPERNVPTLDIILPLEKIGSK